MTLFYQCCDLIFNEIFEISGQIFGRKKPVYYFIIFWILDGMTNLIFMWNHISKFYLNHYYIR
jgi:hypothetical protein